MALAGDSSLQENTSISFPAWAQALAAAPLPDRGKEQYRREIIEFLRYCKGQHTAVTVAVARNYLATRATGAGTVARDALRWFVRASRRPTARDVARPSVAGFQQGASCSGDAGIGGSGATHYTSVQRFEGPAFAQDAANSAFQSGTPVEDNRLHLEPDDRQTRSASGGVPTGGLPPPAARDDLGGADWERDLIAAARRKGFLWRTEQTYREWAAQFAQHLRPRSYSATGDDIASFLSRLAIERRASASTQKQALRVNGFANAADSSEPPNDALRLRALFRIRSRSLYRL